MKRVTLFCGHFGSGKSNIAVNYALHLRGRGLPVALADMDIVNPYFRSADSRDRLEQAGVQVVSLPFANSNVDLPALPAELYGLVQRKDIYAVLDVGGDDRGALALGRYVPYLKAEQNYDMLCVMNFYRPLTRTPEEVAEIIREIEAAAGLRFTGIVNNSNLGMETTAEDVLRTFPLAEETARLTGLPLVMTTCDARLQDKIPAKDLFPLRLQRLDPAGEIDNTSQSVPGI